MNKNTLLTKYAFIFFATMEGVKEPKREAFSSDNKYEKAVERFWKNISLYYFYTKSLPQYLDKTIEEYNRYRVFLKKDKIKKIKYPNLKIKSNRFVVFYYYIILIAIKRVLRIERNIEKKTEKLKKKLIVKIIKESIKNANCENDVIILSNSSYIPSWFYDEAKEKANKEDDGSIIGIPDLVKSKDRCVAFVPKKVSVRKIAKRWTPYDVIDTVCIYII